MAYIASINTIDGDSYDIRSKLTNGILYAQVDSTSTATVFTATIPGVTAYYDGLTIMLKNGVVTSASGFTININGLGAKKAYNNMAAATAETTLFNINYTMLFVYDSTRVSGGGWICYRGYDSNTNTIGYQLRTNSSILKTADKFRYYRMLFTSADNTHWVPANNGTDNSATSTKTVNQRPIDPFGRIVYLSANTNYAAEANVSATAIWDQYTFSLGFSFNWTGAALELTINAPVYVKCAPQSDGSAIIDSTTPIVQALPTTEDGKIYIYLGIAYSATNIEMFITKPVYYYKDNAIRLWTNAPTTSSGSTVSVTQELSSGTKVATITVDNVGTDLYAPTPPTKVSDLTNDSGYITGISSSDVTTALGYTPYNSTNPSGYVDATGAANAAPVQSVNGATGTVVLDAEDVGALPDDTHIPPDMTILSYGSSTWNDFISVYQTKSVVYCRASSNSNPASGSQNRLAFMAYVNDSANPTEVEFQYYRSVATHSDAQQGDQVYVYKLNKTSGWSVQTREAYTKIAVGSNMTKSYSNGTLTLDSTASGSTVSVTQVQTTGTKIATVTVDSTDTDIYTPTLPTASTTNPSMDGTASYGSSTDYARSDHVHPSDTAKQDALVSGTNIKTINNESILGSGNISINSGASISTTTVTIAVGDWSNNTCTKNVTGVTTSNSAIVTYAPSSRDGYLSADIYCSAQGSGTLSFNCATTPETSITVNVMIIS